MKKCITVFILLLAIQGISTAQNLQIDSLRYQLKNSTEDTSLVNILQQLAGYHAFQRPDSGVYYGSKALALARRLEFHNGEFNALHVLGLSHRTLSNYSKALQINLEGLRLAEKYEEINNQGLFQFNVGIIYILLGDYENGLVYVRAFPYNSAKNAVFISILAETWMAKAFANLGELDSAFYYSYEAYKKAIEKNDRRLIMWSSRQLGELHYHLHHTDSAQYYFKQAILNADIDASIRSNATLSLAKLFQQSGQYDSSVFYANTAMEAAIGGGVYEETIDACIFLEELYKEIDPSKALEYLEMAVIYRDSLDQLRQNTTFGDILDFDEQQRQQEIEYARSEFQSRLRINTLIGSSFTLLLIAFFLYRNSRNRQKAKQKIETAYDQLKSTQSQLIQSEKMASLGELTAGIAHEIQNPLNFVNNFSEVNSELIEELEAERLKLKAERNEDLEKEILNYIKENEQKIKHHGHRASEIVKAMLQHSRTSSGEKEPTDINALCDEYLRLAYHGMKAKDKEFNAEFKLELDESLPKVNVVPQDIGRVLLNLINNAFYSVSEASAKEGGLKQSKRSPLSPEATEDKGQTTKDRDYKPQVEVSSRKVADKIEIRVKDNGPGIPEEIREKIFQPFFTTKPTGQGTGLGLSLSYDIVKAHGGMLKVNTEEKHGTKFVITLPLEG